jgi:hypothetical protein
MSNEKSYKQWLVIDWKTGDSRTRKSKPSASDLNANELLAELNVNVEVPEIDVPTLAVNIDVPEPQVYQATMDALDADQLPDWTDAAVEAIEDRRGDIQAAEGLEYDEVVDSVVLRTLRDAPGRPPVEQVETFVEARAEELWMDGEAA